VTVETDVFLHAEFHDPEDPMSINVASVIESAISARVIVAVTAAAYVVVTGVSGSLELSLRREVRFLGATKRMAERREWSAFSRLLRRMVMHSLL
jgi:hypothetical protein